MRSMDEMKADALRAANSGMVCPKCGCKHLKSTRAEGSRGKTYRYRICRNPNCGHKMYTREEIIRDVKPHKVVPEDNDTESDFLPAGNTVRFPTARAS